MAYARLHGRLPALVCRRNAGTSANSGSSSVLAAFGTGEAVPERLLSCERARFAASELPILPRGEGMVAPEPIMSEEALSFLHKFKLRAMQQH